MDIQYKIIFFSDWHCGSGLAAGADVDALVIKDKNGLPYIPGKTIKGLLREAVEDLLNFKGITTMDENSDFIKTFGYFDNEKEEMYKGETFFPNAELSPELKSAIIYNETVPYLYRAISSTAIKNGTALKHSLRRMETVVPCELEGKIIGFPETFKTEIIQGLQYIKRLGQNRNRGLGRCDIQVEGGVS